VIDGAEGELNSVHQDKRCPGLLHHHPALRANFAQSQMVKEGLIILQVIIPIYVLKSLNLLFELNFRAGHFAWGRQFSATFWTTSPSPEV
jgi:hypothetical protein